MDPTNTTPASGSSRVSILETITSPIGFFVLALLIVEGFLATVLVGGGLDSKDKAIGVWLGVTMFILVVILVFVLVCFKPQNFVYDRQAHLDQLRMEQERRRKEVGGVGLQDLAGQLESALVRELTSEELATRLSQASQADVIRVLKQQAGKVADDIKQSSFIKVDLSAFGKGGVVLSFPVAGLKNMNALTDEVYFALQGSVRAYAYGTDWVLREKGSGRVFRTLRMLTNAPVGQPLPDIRSLDEIGIRPGMELEAVRPTAGST